MIAIWLIISAIIGYALGNFSPGLFIARRVARTDIREHGSGGTGATNVLRTLGKKPALVTFLGDVCKGILASLLGLWIAGANGMLLAGACCILGHIWPALYGFRGGKGAASAIGVLLVCSPLHLLIIALIGVAVIALTHYVSLGSLCGAVSYALLALCLQWGNWPFVAFSVGIAAMVTYAHRGNIARLLKGNENKLKFR